MSVVIAAGTRKGLWLATSGPDGDWSVTGPTLTMREVPSLAFLPAGDDPPELLAGVRSEHWGPTVARSGDLGASWEETERAAVRFPADAGAALERIWQLHPDPARPEVVWAGCEPISLWRSTDSGRSFALVQALWDHPHRSDWGAGFGGAAAHTVVTDPADPDRVLVAMSTGGVYATTDGGATWEPRNLGIQAGFLPDPEPAYGQCVHKMAADATGPDRLYLQNHGGVYRSDDAGRRWTSIAAGLPSDFGFPALAHPGRPGVAWVLPLVSDEVRLPPDGRLRPYRTEDAGQTWREVGAGLPEQSGTVVLRDAACVRAADPAAPDGPAVIAFGTREGSLYASTDSGDTFAEVAAHLPDVLCVRAAVLP
jgi:hypothetical protein